MFDIQNRLDGGVLWAEIGRLVSNFGGDVDIPGIPIGRAYRPY